MKKMFVGGLALIAIAVFTFTAFTVSATQTANLMPTNDGAYQDWFSSTGTTGYTNVDETPCNGVRDYNYTTNTSPVWNRETYQVSLASIPTSTIITQIQISPCLSAHTMGTSTIDVFYRFDGTNSTYLGNYTVSGTSPTTLATSTWSGLSLSVTPSSTLQIGVRLTSGNGGGRVSQMSAILTY